MFVILASRDLVLRFHGSVTLKEQVSDVFRSDIIRYVESDDVGVHGTWEREHNDQTNISHVYPSTNVGQINQSWKHDNYSYDSLYNAKYATGTPIKLTSRGSAVLGTDYQHTEVAQYTSWPNVGQKNNWNTLEKATQTFSHVLAQLLAKLMYLRPTHPDTNTSSKDQKLTDHTQHWCTKDTRNIQNYTTYT